jgi:hypothetical protein
MEFKTTQGGETTLVFDEDEQLQLDDIGRRTGTNRQIMLEMLTKQRQANPLANFDGLLAQAFPQIFNSGLVSAQQQRKNKGNKVSPVWALEQDIRRKLAAVASTPIGSTSQTMQVEAMLLQALATCLQTQELKRLWKGRIVDGKWTAEDA